MYVLQAKQVGRFGCTKADKIHQMLCQQLLIVYDPIPVHNSKLK